MPAAQDTRGPLERLKILNSPRKILRTTRELRATLEVIAARRFGVCEGGFAYSFSQGSMLIDHHPLDLRFAGARRWVYLGVGWVAFVFGIAGALLPILPAMPFFFMSLWAFSRSSPELERWLLNHRWIGPGLRRFREHSVVPLSVKVGSVTCMVGAFVLAALSGRLPLWALGTQAFFVAVGCWFILRFPSKEPPPSGTP